MRNAALVVLCLAGFVGRPVVAQDSIPVEQGVRIGITYAPGVRPGMLVLGGSGGGDRTTALDSARTIITRDLHYGDLFEMIVLPMGDSLSLTIGRSPGEDGDTAASHVPFVNYALYRVLGADYAVDVSVDRDSSVVVTLHDVAGELTKREVRIPNLNPNERDFRMRVHRAADELVRVITGVSGIAASQILFINAGRIYRVDFDGHTVEALSPEGQNAMSPVWAPDGHRAVYMEFQEGLGPLFMLDLDTGERRVLPFTQESLNFAPAFSPDGGTLAFSRAGDDGTDIYAYNLADDCCLQRLTVGGFSDNLSPTFSPDGQRIAHVSNRPGTPQIYVMASDGTGQELFAPFDYGVSGSSHAPEWSADGLSLTFDRDVGRVPQIFVMEVAGRKVRQLTSLGRNYDPTWAPDGRHLAFVSTRTGSQQVWIIDMETGAVRQLTRLGEARLPAWSPRIPERLN